MPGAQRTIYRIGKYTVDTGQRVLLRDGDVVSIAPKAVDTLIVLIQHAGEVVDKDCLFATVWPNAFVAESSLTKNICILRKTLDEPGQESVIQTVSKRGYRYAAPVSEDPLPEAAEAAQIFAQANEPKPGFPARWRRIAVAAAVLILSSAVYVQSYVHPAKTLSEADRLVRIGRYMWSKFDAAATEKA